MFAQATGSNQMPMNCVSERRSSIARQAIQSAVPTIRIRYDKNAPLTGWCPAKAAPASGSAVTRMPVMANM